MEQKPFYLSKTLWFSALFVLISGANLVGFANFEPDPALVGIVEAVIFAVLRFVTSKGVAVPGLGKTG